MKSLQLIFCFDRNWHVTSLATEIWKSVANIYHLNNPFLTIISKLIEIARCDFIFLPRSAKSRRNSFPCPNNNSLVILSNYQVPSLPAAAAAAVPAAKKVGSNMLR